MNNRYLPTALRRALEKAIKAARSGAEDGARDAIRRLGVAEGKAPPYLSDEEKQLRRRLRAHARALGDPFDKYSDRQETKRLTEAAAYAHWHRMLFARFLADRGLLRHPQHDVPVSLEDCRELAAEEGFTDGWAVAERYAAAMLPAVFRIDDPVLALDLDPVHTQQLNRLVTVLDPEVFQAEDSLGWTYQFWRAAEKDAVNKSGVKIGADELPAVTQLFTEPYMVRFLLHNTLGAWWAGKVLAGDPALAETAADENSLRAACALPGYGFDMLRFVREGEDGPWRPAAGTFPGWPREAKAITMLDPCCGSGHFLTEALAILAALRQAEEELSPTASVAAVLRDNIHGLEIDERCVQIAAFAVALTAWRIGGHQALPLPQIAWVGAPPPLPKQEFVALADGDPELEYALAALHNLFLQAPLLGSLLEPSGGDLFEAEKMREIERLLEPLVAKVRRAEPERAEGVIAARGMADAAALLARRYTLQSTNVPFLGRGKQDRALATHIGRVYPEAKADLSSAMLRRMTRLAAISGTVSSVTPQNWLFLGSYKRLREQLLQHTTLNIVAVLGEHGFDSSAAAGAFTALAVMTARAPGDGARFACLDADDAPDPPGKAAVLSEGKPQVLSQKEQLARPSAAISTTPSSSSTFLGTYARCLQGLTTGDDVRLKRQWWEVMDYIRWLYFQGPSQRKGIFSGREDVIDAKFIECGGTTGALRGREAWGKRGVAIDRVRSLSASLYDGDFFHSLIPVIIPLNENNIEPIAAFLLSEKFPSLARESNRSLSIDNGYFSSFPFDLDHWQKVAAQKYPNGLPSPYSDDPTQWIFHGHPAQADIGTALHVALTRLAGYRWPAETDSKMRLSAEARDWIVKAATLPAADTDGLLCLPAVAAERPLAERLRAYLVASFGAGWSDAVERRLVAEADERFDKRTARDGSLEGWLRERAFRQHCKLFHDRPFLWQVWDGLKDGFSVFIHYHRLDQATLRKLTYTVLGDWLARARDEKDDLRAEKGRVLQQALEKILDGEAPYDIFVRWKSLAQQPLGWDPDLDDGVRMTIRPFVEAGILRDQPNIKWGKDRGKDVKSAPWYPVFNGERINDHHTPVAEKTAARAEALEPTG